MSPGRICWNVANVGGDTNWTGSHFNQANWYVFGRIARGLRRSRRAGVQWGQTVIAARGGRDAGRRHGGTGARGRSGAGTHRRGQYRAADGTSKETVETQFPTMLPPRTA